MARDLHSALKTEVLDKISHDGLEAALVRLQWSKADYGFSLHVRPNSFTMSGTQRADLLDFIGFKLAECSFLRDKCFHKEVNEGFDTRGFLQAFSRAYEFFCTAESLLGSCGFYIEQPQGWGHLTGKSTRRPVRPRGASGDGHTAPEKKIMKETEDPNFKYVFTWIKGGQDKGWTTHYLPKHLPLSAEISAVFKFLRIKHQRECPENDFDPCYWAFTSYAEGGNSFMGNNADVAHMYFDNHAKNMSRGIETLLEAQSHLEPYGLGIFPIESRQVRLASEMDIRTKPATSTKHTLLKASNFDTKFDVALSFAGQQREIAKQIATRVRDAGFRIFYDDFYPEALWGKDLPVLFDEIYRQNARYCVVLVSEEYLERMWTNHERRMAQTRALEERGREYILPVKVDHSELPGTPSTTGYLALSQYSPEQVADLLIKKLSDVG